MDRVALFFFNASVNRWLVVPAAMLPLLWTMRARPVWQARLKPVCSALVAMERILAVRGLM
jgi:hypothetical protein